MPKLARVEEKAKGGEDSAAEMKQPQCSDHDCVGVYTHTWRHTHRARTQTAQWLISSRWGPTSSCRRGLPGPCSLFLSLTLSDSRSDSLSLSLSLYLSFSLSFPKSLALSMSGIHTLTLALTHTRTHSLTYSPISSPVLLTLLPEAANHDFIVIHLAMAHILSHSMQSSHL
jgi:hypothetical protein